MTITETGARHVYTLRPGERAILVEGFGILITHPDRPPFVVHADGRIEPLNPAPTGEITVCLDS